EFPHFSCYLVDNKLVVRSYDHMNWHGKRYYSFDSFLKNSGHREPKKDPLTVIIDKINEKYGTHFTEMDKVLVQMENDYANQEKWQSYAKNNDRATFMLLFEKDFPNMAADRYEQNDQFFRKLFDDPDMMRQVMETVGSVLYERLKKKYIFDPKSGVIEEATPETYVEDTYLTKK
ncbi:hypothetical protein KQI13_14130, partial [Anaerostipes hadrus]|nr:hypothetical protein [Anaerostipes hadrus]